MLNSIFLIINPCFLYRNLMMKEDWKNLGYNDLVNGESNTINGASKDDPP